MIEYFNRKSVNAGLDAVDWKAYEASIHTKDVVGRIQAKYEEFMQHEYNVDAAASLIGTRSEKMKQLEFVNTYNQALWTVHYLLHLNQMETLRNLGDPTELSINEWLHLNPAAETNPDWDLEIRDDVIEECNKYGGIHHIYVDKTSPQGNIYAKCPNVQTAVSAVNALHGRWFAGKTNI